ncbi:MAG: hypothetical protein M1838_003741 [Thelocarpon superellum]|nr:MAG: hypothetical protein M1838_003741 [Thelocarpon superellum]
MVSQTEPPDRTLAIRRPPSVSSRTSTRRHRHNRSHHGGSSYQAQNEFPIFSHTGDVEIVIGAGGKEQRYLLHRLILAQCSGFFEAGTSEQWSRAQNAAGQSQDLARIGEAETEEAATSQVGELGQTSPPKMRWRYVLEEGPREDGDAPMLVQRSATSTLFGGDQSSRPPTTRHRQIASQPGFFRSVVNLSAVQIPRQAKEDDPAKDTLRDYDNLFRIFYNYPPTLDNVNIANAYIECKSLLNLADMYDALEVVGPRVDHHLLQFQGRLWKQIAKYPPSYLKLGYLARSKVIFAEALVHVVGQWPAGANHLRSQLPEQVLDVIEDKVDELDETKCKIESQLFRLTLVTSRGERVTPSTSYLDWTVVSLFRQWLAENTTPLPPPTIKDSARPATNNTSTHAPTTTTTQVIAPIPPPPLPSNTGRIYRLIGTGGSAYLAHEEIKRFMKLRPDDYSREAVRRFERRMDELKSLAREIVRPLMRNFLELDLGKDGGNMGYLTCTHVLDRDFPWDD